MNVNIDDWIEGYKVRAFNWIDGKSIYINVQYYKSGQSLSQPPAWEKTAFLTINEEAQRIMDNLFHTLICHIAMMDIPKGGKAVLTA
jgi:hypothetical protein